MAVPLAQKVLLFGVILHQLSQRGELLTAVQVIVVARVLDLDVGHLITPSVRGWGRKLVISSFFSLTGSVHTAMCTVYEQKGAFIHTSHRMNPIFTDAAYYFSKFFTSQQHI